MADLFESADFAYAGIIASVYGANWWHAQTFTPAATHDISSVILALGRPSGDTPGTVTVSIRATGTGASAGKPVGADLCSGTTNGNTVPQLGWPTPVPEEREITFGTPYTLVSGTQYAIVVRALSGTSFNKLYWMLSESSVYAGGTEVFGEASGTDWSVNAAQELWFEEYGDPATPGKATSPSPANTATGVSTNQATLTWTEGTGTVNYEQVYFGPSGSMVSVDALDTDQSFDLSDYLPLAYGTTYQWRIDSVNDTGTTTGDTWSFTTLTFTPPTVGDGSFQIIKRLCACAENRFWYEDV